MIKLINMLVLISMVLGAGCGREDEPRQKIQLPKVPTSAEYKSLLEKRASSVDGADINILQEVGKFMNATDDEKIELYNSVKSLVR